MKKILITLGMFVSLLGSNKINAKIAGVEIKVEYESGHKEWNGDKTHTECVGKGVCRVTLSGSTSVMSIARLENGNIGLVIKTSELDSERVQELMVNGGIFIGKNVDLDVKTINALAKQGIDLETIKAGTYKVTESDKVNTIYDLRVK